jgi:hypothetical protein
LRRIAVACITALFSLAGADGEGLPYGTNRITPANLYTLQQKVQWTGPGAIQVLRTDHFDVYMGKEEEAIASRIAAIAEDWYPRLEERMGIRFDSLVEKGERIPLVGYTSATRFQTTNTSPGFVGEGVQGFYDLIRGRIVLPFTGSNELLEHVIRHEMVHSFTLPLVDASWKRYQEDRDRVRERRRAWGDLVYVAHRFTRGAPEGTFPRFVRGALVPVEDEVGLPPPAYGAGKLHPQIFLGFAGEERSDDARIRVSVRLADPEEAASLRALPDSSRAALAEAMARAGGGRTSLRVLSRTFPWTVEAETRVLFEEAVPAGNEAAHVEGLARALEGAPAAGAHDSSRTRAACDLLVLDAVDPSRFREAWERLAPLYTLLARLPYGGDPLPEHARPSSARFEEAERELHRYVPPDLRPRLFPLPVLEGVAEFYAGEWTDLNDVVLRDVVHEGKLVPFQDLGPQHGYLVYVEGLSFFRYLADRYGEEKVGLLLESLYRGRRTSDVFEAVYGEEVDTLAQAWEFSLRRRFLAQFPDQMDVLEYAKQLPDGDFVGPPRADAGRVLYASYRHGRAEIRLAEGRRTRSVAKDRLPGFESFHLGDPNLDIRGNRAAFVALSKGRDEIVLVSLPAGKTLSRHRFDGLLTIESLALSPDGRDAVLSALDETGRSDLFRFSFGRGSLERLTDDAAHETDLAWGERGVLFASDRERSGRYDLYRIDPDGNEERLLALERSVGSPRWNGERILLLARLGDRAKNVHLFDPETGTLLPVTRDAVGISAFDCDGNTLYVRTNRGLRFTLWKTPLPDLANAAAPVVAAAPPAEVSRPAPAPVDYERRPYARKYGPDIFFVTGSAFYTQTLLGISDILGDRKIALFVGSNADRSEDLVKYLSGGTTIHFLEGRIDYRLGAFRYADQYLTDRQGFFFRRETGMLAGLTYPLDRFRSAGVNVLVKHVREEPQGAPEGRSFGEATVQGILGYDTTVPERLGYGFGSGVLASVLFSADAEWNPKQDVRSGTVLGDLRVYVPFGRDFVWANRASGGLSVGDFPQQILIGGSLTLRGYDYLSLTGDRYFLVNEEVRFPLPLRLFVGSVPVVSRLQGAAFLDAGDAWFDGRSPVLRGSTGFGLRTGLGGAVLRWDLARKFEERKLLPGWETDFFIGWNF